MQLTKKKLGFHHPKENEDSAVPHKPVDKCIQFLGSGIQNRDGNVSIKGDLGTISRPLMAFCSELILKLPHQVTTNNTFYGDVYISGNEASQALMSKPKEGRRHTVLESFRFQHIDARRLTIPRADTNTCMWFFKTPEYLSWIDNNKFDSHGGLLWIKGKPGAGKSTLMKFALHHVYEIQEGEGNLVISFFFNARGEALEKSTVGLYRSLLLQLFEARPSLQYILDSVVLEHEWCVESLESLFEKALRDITESSLVCFIDALDECEEQQVRGMISFLLSVSDQVAAAGTKLRVCFASRHYPHITIERGLNLVVEGREEHRQDIANYLKTNLRIGNDSLAKKIRSELQEKASGVFMWVVLVTDILTKEYDRGRKHRLRQRLRDIPNDLHDLFRDILIKDNDDSPGLLCIQWVLFARRPLSPKELYFAIMSGTEPDSLSSYHTEQDITTDDIERYILDNSKGLVELTDSETPTVQFIHESVRDFLVRENGLQKMWPKLSSNLEGHSHERLKQCCLAYLNDKIILESKLSSPLPKASIPKARRTVAERFPFLEYANQNILYHADKAEKNKIIQKKFISDFPLAKWVYDNNLFERYQIRRYTAGASLLYILAERDLPDLIRGQTSRQSCFSVEESRYRAPLFAAFAAKNSEAMQALLERQVQFLSSDLPLHQMFVEGRQVINGAGARRDFTLSSKEDEAFYFLENGSNAILKLLLTTEEIDFATQNQKSQTLLEAAVVSRNKPAIKLLLEHGDEIKTPRGTKAFAKAVEKGYKETVKLLLNRGASIDACYNQYTPLKYAIRREDEDMVQLLLDKGADIDICGPENDVSCALTPLCLAAQDGSEAMVRLLLKNGADPEGCAHTTPLYVAARNGHEIVVKLLLDSGANVEGDGINTPLLGAVLGQHDRIVQLLLDRDANIHCEDSEGRTPLKLAAGTPGNQCVVRILCASGASIAVPKATLFRCAWSVGRVIVMLLFLQIFLNYTWSSRRVVAKRDGISAVDVLY